MQHALAIYGYAALLPLCVIEGPAVTVIAAFLAAQGILDVGMVYLVVVAGDLLGDLLYYAIGRFVLRRLAARHRAERLRHRVTVLAPRIRKHAGTMLLFGKLTHSAGFVVLLAAGATHVPLRRFLLFNVLGTLPKALVLVAVGYWFGQLYGTLHGDLQIAALVGFVLASGALALGARWLLEDQRGSA